MQTNSIPRNVIRYTTIFFLFICLKNQCQTSLQNFGTSSSTYGSGQTGSASYITNPTGSGTTYARTSNSQGGAITLNTTGNYLGTTGAYIKCSASSAASVCKISPIVNYTSSKVFYAKFKMILGDGSGGASATSGEWRIFLGNGSMYNDNNDFTGTQVFTGIRFTFGASGALTLNNRNGSNWNTTGLSVTAFDQATFYAVEIIGNNQSSGNVNYSYNGVSQTVAINKFDLYMNGVLIGNDVAIALQANNTNISSITFIGENSTSNAANIYLDDVSLSNTVPSALGGATNPSAFNLSSGNYSFSNWSSSSSVGAYPSNMIFHYADVNQTDPALSQVNATQDYVYGYNYTKSTRINAQGSNGFSFVNTNPGQVSITSGNLGEAVLALNTTCRTNVQVSWKAGTIVTNTRVYKLRAQYRVGTIGSYTDLPNTSVSQIEYTSPNTATSFGPITLPSSCENQPVVQIRWVYYWSSGISGSRDEIYLDDIVVSSSSTLPAGYSVTGGGAYCSGSTAPSVGLSNSQSGTNYQLYSGALAIGSPVAGTGSSISFGIQSSAGTYSVLATNTVNSCTLSMSGNVVVSVNPLPTVTAVSGQTVCGGKSLNTFSFSSSPSGSTFFWNNTNTQVGLASNGIGNISSFSSPLVTSDQLATVSVNANLAGCFGPQVNFNILVKGPQPASEWTGAISSAWNDPDNWTNCVCGSSTNGTIAAVSSPSFNPVITTTASVNDLTINSGALLTHSTTQIMDVFGQWLNNGTFTMQTGEINFTGITQQTISGSSSNVFYNVSLNNSAGLLLNTTSNVKGTLQLNSGIFDTNDLLTLAADANNTGRIGPINSSADIINKVSVEQYAQPGYTGWALMGSPVNSSLTMADWNDDFVITCPNCPNGYYNFTSIYSYSEAAVGTYSDAAKYVGIDNTTDALTYGSGYWVYLGNGSIMTTGIVFDTKGTVAKSTCLSCSTQAEIPLSYTNQGSVPDDGWNLISNPLPSAISWTALRNNNPNVDAAIYAFNADQSNGAGAFVSYVNGIASTTTGGINDTIPMCQGFYIHATGNATLVAAESIKVNGNPAYLKQTSSVAAKPTVRLSVFKNGSKKDQATFYFENGVNPLFDPKYDTYKMVYDITQPYICSVSGNKELEINGMPDPLAGNISAPVKVIVTSTAIYSLSASTLNFPAGVCAELYDTYTGITTNILSSSYTCTLSDTTTAARFILSFKTTTLAATATVIQPFCTNVNGGKIIATGNSGAPWNYIWKNAAGSVIKTTLNTNGSDSITQLSGSNYNVWINSNGSCSNFTQTLTINPVILPVAAFIESTDTVDLFVSPALTLNNTSQNAGSYFWSFGDGNYSSASNPVHTYSTVGNYSVSLIASSATQCSDTISKQITVLNNVVGLQDLDFANEIVIESESSSEYNVRFNFNAEEKISLTLTDVSGKLIFYKNDFFIKQDKVHVSLSDHLPGVYILKVNRNSGKANIFKLLGN